ncbi:imidazoleglycerol-phosphate dehydratase HisB [Candidatus Hikarchaeum yamanae]|uniref:imidazoleglycerol-phosphate dehydratase HisB n=1 Tax=Candidatus Hikarchaeum yamanae TaxID=2675326 RepID=UPI0039E96460|tara:strand:- start:36568 stop:37260 length:693 start_codon:yes stop_codon:yes gene_type:complete
MPTCEYCNESFSERGIGTHRRWCKGRVGSYDEEGGSRARKAEIRRETNETAIELELNIDGSGKSNINTGIGFFDHVLESFATHGLFDLKVQAVGDIEVDGHHTIEDVGIVLGKAFCDAWGDKAGINRFAERNIPMDESIASAILDISGRPYFSFEGMFSEEQIGNFTSGMAPHFFRSFAMNSGITLHCAVKGTNAHHEIEALFKAVGRAIDDASRIEGRREGTPSTKGGL